MVEVSLTGKREWMKGRRLPGIRRNRLFALRQRFEVALNRLLRPGDGFIVGLALGKTPR
jgi:hypothetical protein